MWVRSLDRVPRSRAAPRAVARRQHLQPELRAGHWPHPSHAIPATVSASSKKARIIWDPSSGVCRILWMEWLRLRDVGLQAALEISIRQTRNLLKKGLTQPDLQPSSVAEQSIRNRKFKNQQTGQKKQEHGDAPRRWPATRSSPARSKNTRNKNASVTTPPAASSNPVTSTAGASTPSTAAIPQQLDAGPDGLF